MESAKVVSEVDVSDIMSVYSGKDGKCCCGCAGKHYYASALRQEGSENRGYEVRDEEVSDKMVRKVLKLIKDADKAKVEIGGSAHFGVNVSVVVGERWYIAYLRKGVSVRNPDAA